MDLASNIKAIRKAKGITPTMMAKELGIEATNYPKFENRGNQLTYSNLERICGALGVTVIELLTWDDNDSSQRRIISAKEAQEKIRELTTARDIAQEYAESLKRKVMNINHSFHSIIRDIGDEAGLGKENIVEEDELYTLFHTTYTDDELLEIFNIMQEKHRKIYYMFRHLLTVDTIDNSTNEGQLFLKNDNKKENIKSGKNSKTPF